MNVDCRCTLHPRRNHIDACRACAFQHFPASRDADVSAIPVADVPRRHREASDTLRGHAAVRGASLLRPALVSGTSSEGAHALTTSVPVDLRPSEEGVMLRDPSPAPRLPLSAGTRSRTAGGGR